MICRVPISEKALRIGFVLNYPIKSVENPIDYQKRRPPASLCFEEKKTANYLALVFLEININDDCQYQYGATQHVLPGGSDVHHL